MYGETHVFGSTVSGLIMALCMLAVGVPSPRSFSGRLNVTALWIEGQAARRTASTLVFPVSLRIVASIAFGENYGMGVGRFLLRYRPVFAVFSLKHRHAPRFRQVLKRSRAPPTATPHASIPRCSCRSSWRECRGC